MRSPHTILSALPSSRLARVLLLAGVAHFLLLVFLGLTRHWGFLTSAHDLGIYDQSLWGILNGSPFLSTASELDLVVNHLGVHFNPILATFVPLYAILPAAEWLALIQALAISITAWPLYRLGVRLLSSEHAAALWTLVYLMNPFVLNAAAWDFHPIVLAAPVMTLTMLALELKRARLMLLGCIVLLLIREHLGVAVAGLGVLWWLRQRTFLPGFSAILIGGVGFVIVVGLIIPAFSPAGSHLMLSEDLGQLSRYVWLGTSPTEVLRSLLLHPIDAMRFALFELGGWVYLFFLLIPLALTPLIGAEFLLPAGADLAVNLLSANPMPRSVFAYHSIALIPVFVIAGMHGACRLSRLDRYSVTGLGRLVVFSSLLMTYRLLPLPLPGAINIWEPLEYRMWPERSVRDLRALLPPEMSVSAQANVVPHFTQRTNIRVFPNGVGEADCIVLRLASPTARIKGDNSSEVGGLAHHLQMAPGSYLARIQAVIASGEYGLKYWNGPWLLLCRSAAMTDIERSRILSELEDLARTWSVSSFLPPSL